MNTDMIPGRREKRLQAGSAWMENTALRVAIQFTTSEDPQSREKRAQLQSAILEAMRQTLSQRNPANGTEIWPDADWFANEAELDALLFDSQSDADYCAHLASLRADVKQREIAGIPPGPNHCVIQVKRHD